MAQLSRFPSLIRLRSLRRFCSLPNPMTATTEAEAVQNDAELVSKILLEHHNPFHAMESSLQLHGITLSPQLLHQTLLRLKHNSKIALALFHYANSLPTSSSPIISADAFTLLIDIVAKVRQYDVAWQLILQMMNSSSSTTTTTAFAAAILVLIRRLISSGLTRQAIRAFHDIEVLTLTRLTTQDFCFLLDTLCKYGHVRLAAQVFNQKKHEFTPDTKMYTVLMYGWCKIGRFNIAERFLRDMIERGIEPNEVTYNVYLDGICRRASLHPVERFERTIRNAHKVFDEMSSRGIEPDVTSFSILLHVYSRAHKPELALDKLKEMRERGICPTVATYTSVVKCLCSCGRLGDAEELLGEMVRNGVTPSAATYNCFFKEYRGRKDWKSALKLYKKMKEECLFEPSVHTYNIMMGMFLQLNRVEVVREILEDMKESGAGPDLDSYTMLIHGLCEKHKWREACEFFVEMIEKGLLPQKVTFETLYRGLIQSDMLRTWRRLKKRLDEESVTFGKEFQNYHLKPYRR